MSALFNATGIKQYIDQFQFTKLFINVLGWDNPPTTRIPLQIDETDYTLIPVAKKHLLVVYECRGPEVPNRATQKKIHARLRQYQHENFIIFTDNAHTRQKWFFVWRDPGQSIRAHVFDPNEDLFQRLKSISFSIDEEEGLSPIEVLSRVRGSFDVDKVTKSFYDDFKKEHNALTRFLEGIPDREMKAWYVSVTLNRLMFVYFIQKKGFLDKNPNYLRDKLTECKKHGKDLFYREFLCSLFFDGFATKSTDRDPATRRLLGDIPYLNGGIFQPHQIEQRYGQAIRIPDRAFEQLFQFFDGYRWHLDDRPTGEENEINPDVLGYIFEKYINQKQMGAYYTKEDITGYISRNTILPWLFDQSRKNCKIAFEGDRSVWDLLKNEPDRYIYPAVQKGCKLDLPPEIEAGIADVSQRGPWNTPAEEAYALPTEIWRETVARRQRYQKVHDKLAAGEIHDINDLITYNLDIQLFAQDVIQNAEGPELVRAFWKALTHIKVLDPTVGSGAFLFAAMNILEPLYEDCIEQMEHYVNTLKREDHPDKFKDFKAVLDQIGEHASPKYYIYKTITIRNLYGVDIMEEAVETCKLRLFLKLVSQVARKRDLEPLPDIDFNVRAGNTLVGFTSLDEVKEALSRATKETKGGTPARQDALLMLPEENQQLERIREEAELASRAYARFQEMQTGQGMDAADFREAKSDLQRRLDVLNEELNRALALSYGVNLDEKKAYLKWLASHQPFNWVVDFYEIIQRGGFDVIIGNPPYVEYSKVKNLYTVKNSVTISANNLYALITEKSILITKTSSRLGLILPSSSVSAAKTECLRNSIRYSSNVWVSNYAWRPSTLFEGANMLLAIWIIKKIRISEIDYASKYYRFYKEYRNYLFETISFTKFETKDFYNRVPKIPNLIGSDILQKCINLSNNKLLSMNLINKHGNYSLFYFRAVLYWIKILNKPPVFLEDGQPKKTSEMKEVFFSSKIQRDSSLCLLSSNLFTLFYTIWSSCQVINLQDFDFPIDLNDFANKMGKDLSFLSSCLQKDLLKNSIVQTREYSSRGRTFTMEKQYFFIKKSKLIIDKIDRVLANYFGFTEEELDFIINYDIKYRMGDELNSEDEEDGVSEEENQTPDDDPVEEVTSTFKTPPATPTQPNAKPAAAVRMELPFEPTDYSLYRCLKCNKLVLAFDQETHTREVHGGEYPGYEKLGG